MRDESQRRAILEYVLTNPPAVHFSDPIYGLEPPGGVWRTHRSCYEFLSKRCGPGARTLETGLGISTALFTMWGCDHTSIVPWEIEAERLMAYLALNEVDTQNLTVIIGYSQDILPNLDPTPLDLVLVDGGHGYPTAVIDWFYAGARLVKGGILVLDDLHLPSVTAGLVDFLDQDPRWLKLVSTNKWAAWQRESSGSLNEEWTKQPFFSPFVEAADGPTSTTPGCDAVD
jgi:hypothetical protein